MKTLIIGPSWVGDMMMSQSLYRTLKAKNPAIQIDVLAPEWSRPLLSRMSQINKSISMPIKHGALSICERRTLATDLAKENYQQSIVLPNSFKSALIPFFAHIPKRTGWRGEMRYGLLNDYRILNKQDFPLMVQRYVALAYDKTHIHNANDLSHPLLWPELTVAPQELIATTEEFNLDLQQPSIGFCPGAEFGPAKRWPDYHYASLAEKLIKQGYKILLLGSVNDHSISEQILALIPASQRSACVNLSGRTSLEQVIILIAYCAAIISNDSGLMHIAAALNTALVALYGPSSPDFTPPLTHRVKVIRLISGYSKIRASKAHQGYHQSLVDIQPDWVVSALNRLLTSKQKES